MKAKKSIKNKSKKKIINFSRYIFLLVISIFLGLFILFCFNKVKAISKKNSSEIEGNVLYSGMNDLKKVYFIKENGSKAIYIKSKEKEEIVKDLNINLIKNRKEVYRTEKDILWTDSYINSDFLFMTLNTENENVLLKMDLKTNKVEEIIKEKGEGFYSFLVTNIEDKYLIGMYIPSYSEAFKGDRFIVNLENNKKIIIEKDNIAGDIKIDKERNKAVWNKVKKEYVNCYANQKDFPNGCNGMYEENRRYFHFVATDEMIEVSLP